MPNSLSPIIICRKTVSPNDNVILFKISFKYFQAAYIAQQLKATRILFQIIVASNLVKSLITLKQSMFSFIWHICNGYEKTVNCCIDGKLYIDKYEQK